MTSKPKTMIVSATLALSSQLSGRTAGATTWNVGGNALTGTGVVGSTNNFGVEVWVNNARAMRFAPTAGTADLIGGYPGNAMGAIVGGTLVGGGASGSVNSITDDYGFVGGGMSNRAGDNAGTGSDAPSAVVVGGQGNTAAATWSGVVGGVGNTVSGLGSFIGAGSGNGVTSGSIFSAVVGGKDNHVTASYSTVGGGWLNYAQGQYSVVPGGQGNSANGGNSLAAGYQAVADYDGCFVWSSTDGGSQSCGAANRFVVRASGGVYHYTNGASTIGAFLGANQTQWQVLSDRTTKTDIAPVNARDVLRQLTTSLPIYTWTYKDDPTHLRHMGPMAQDFHSAFRLNGEDDRHIGTMDADGVVFAAIRGLNEKIETLEVANRRLAVDKDAILARLDRLESSNARVAARGGASPGPLGLGVLGLVVGGVWVLGSNRRKR